MRCGKVAPLSENVPFGEAERKAYGAGPERGGTTMRQDGTVFSGKAGRPGGVRRTAPGTGRRGPGIRHLLLR